jgi:AcrR family transcriptional regulator
VAEPGLRERSKTRRREAIVRAAFVLFAERGYHATTVADIAEAAEVAPRTAALYFPAKQDIALSRFSAFADRLAGAIRDRGAGETTLDVTGHLLRTEDARTGDGQIRELGRRMFAANPELRALRNARMSATIDEAATAIARDSGRPVGEVGARLAAVVVAAILVELADSAPGPGHTDAVDTALRLLRAAIATL